MIGRFVAGVHWASKATCWVSAATLAFMMLLTLVDVVGRYVFNAPIVGAQDLIEVCMVIVVWGAVGQVTKDGAHVRADLLSSVLSPRWAAIVSGLGLLLSLAVTLLILWRAFVVTRANVVEGDVVTPILNVPVSPFYVVAVIGLGLMALELAIQAVRHFKEAPEAVAAAPLDAKTALEMPEHML